MLAALLSALPIPLPVDIRNLPPQSGWEIGAAVASISVAVLTGLLAIATFRLASETKELARETRESIMTAQQEARQVDRHHQQALWAYCVPVISVAGHSARFAIRNIGDGLAVWATLHLLSADGAERHGVSINAGPIEAHQQSQPILFQDERGTDVPINSGDLEVRFMNLFGKVASSRWKYAGQTKLEFVSAELPEFQISSDAVAAVRAVKTIF